MQILKAEKIIIEELKKATTIAIPLLVRKMALKKMKDENNTWIIDPIDGTTNFLHGVPHFAISIGH